MDTTTTSKRKPRQQRAAAYHEAGHGIMRHVLLGDVGPFLEIYPDGGGLAESPTAGQMITMDRARMDADIMISLAGPLAEARACRVSLVAIYLSTGRHDVACAEEFVRVGERMFGGGDFQRYEDHTRDLVREHWATIDRVARALLPAKRLDEPALRALIGGAS